MARRLLCVGVREWEGIEGREGVMVGRENKWEGEWPRACPCGSDRERMRVIV